MESFAENDSGLLYVADGHSPLMRWDGLTLQMEEAGIVAPTVGVTISNGAGSGAIQGVYFAFLRFVDRFGNVSDLSPVSTTLTAAGATGAITGASNATPIEITSVAHGLTTGMTVVIDDIQGNTAANGTFVLTVTGLDTFTLASSIGNADYIQGGTWSRGIGGITYGSVQVPTDVKVTRRQILRNTDGQADTFYVDVDTADLTSTSFTSTLTDSELSAQEAQPLLDNLGRPLANVHGVPVNHKPFLAHHLGRLFLAGQVDYKRGMVKVTTGSTTVTGVGTDWTSGLGNRYLYIDGTAESYQISSVSLSAQTLTLTSAYQGTTNKFAMYAIRPAPAERRLVYYSEAGFADSVPAFNALSVPEDGDEVTGAMQRSSFVFILEKKHVWKLTFQDDPQTDGAIFLTANRGCINQRSWVVVDNKAYLLDEEGVWLFSGGAESVSDPIQEIFRPLSRSRYVINWQASDHFHAAHSRNQSTIRWFVCLEGDFLPRHALCYNYRLQRWSIEEYPVPIGSSAVGIMNGVEQVFLGGPGGKIYALGQGFLDGADAGDGTVQGTVTAASLFTLSDGLASFAACAGAPVVITGGTGKGQRRQVVDLSATSLTLDRPWLIMPDTTSTYQVGGVQWNWKSSCLRFAANETDERRRLEIVFQPTTEDATLDARFFQDFSSAAEVQRVSTAAAQGGGVATTSGKADHVVDLTTATGVVQILRPGHKEYFASGQRYTQFELAGVGTDEPITIYQLAYEGVAQMATIGGGGQ